MYLRKILNISIVTKAISFKKSHAMLYYEYMFKVTYRAYWLSAKFWYGKLIVYDISAHVTACMIEIYSYFNMCYYKQEHHNLFCILPLT